MATATRKCKVCGCEYEYCHTSRRVEGVFRWQDVACSPQHGQIYLERILASRSADPVEPTSDDVSSDDQLTIDELVEGNEDELFEEDFDDSEDEPVIEI